MESNIRTGSPLFLYSSKESLPGRPELPVSREVNPGRDSFDENKNRGEHIYKENWQTVYDVRYHFNEDTKETMHKDMFSLLSAYYQTALCY